MLSCTLPFSSATYGPKAWVPYTPPPDASAGARELLVSALAFDSTQRPPLAVFLTPETWAAEPLPRRWSLRSKTSSKASMGSRRRGSVRSRAEKENEPSLEGLSMSTLQVAMAALPVS